MASRPLREFQALNILANKFPGDSAWKKLPYATIGSLDDLPLVEKENPWVLAGPLVCKVDQLIKRRAKTGLISINSTWADVQAFIKKLINAEFTVGNTTGIVKSFILLPFVQHKQDEEAYVCIHSEREHDVILFHHAGGVDIGSVEDKAQKLDVPVGSNVAKSDIVKVLLAQLPKNRVEKAAEFIEKLHEMYRREHFTYIEINPLVITDDQIFVLDMATKVDSAADYLFPDCPVRGSIEYPAPFGRAATKEESKVSELDSKTGSSLKLTVLNERGRIWTMVAGGGASVIYADTIVDMGGVDELANYGEYSGGPNEMQTYKYAATIVELMCRHKHRDGKVLIIGGGIANFTNVADTFKGIMRALREAKSSLQEHHTKIFVRRGGPNHLEGLRLMRELGSAINVPIHVYGPETHMTAIVGMALGKTPIVDPEELQQAADDAGAKFLLPTVSWDTFTPKAKSGGKEEGDVGAAASLKAAAGEAAEEIGPTSLMHKATMSIVFGRQFKAIQGMLDFDYICRRSTPSVACIVDPFNNAPRQDFYWGCKQIFISIYNSLDDAVGHHKDADFLVNFASLRSAYDVTMNAMQHQQIRTIAIIAEGIPENMTRFLIKTAQEKKVTIIGPATVGGIKPGCFRIGNTGGMMDNIIRSKLYRPGAVAYVSRSGGMSNELNNILSIHANGVYEGVAIGGDRYPGSTFVDHLLRYEADPDVKMLVLLGEVGGTEEYLVCDLLKSKKIKKTLVAWCIGTCQDMFTTDVQFGHAGASACGDKETASAKNKALAAAGAVVPDNFDLLGVKISDVYNELVMAGIIVPKPEIPPPPVPMDYSWAREVGLIRRPASFVTSLTDERGDELMYSGVKISEVVDSGKGIGGVMALLWFQRDLPDYFCQFLELCLIVTADHGPAVSGAHNTIIAARAGKDLVSSLSSGLLTIGPRFGGALNAAAEQFSDAFDRGIEPAEFVANMRKNNKYIMGIGHRVKSVENPDSRVSIIRMFVKRHFPACPLLEYATKVEAITTKKRSNLILNVDGAIAVSFVDLLRESGQFTREEADRYLKMGILNAVFVLGRSTGFIGHYIDQLRLDQGLYRHPWDDINYILPK